MTFPLPTGRAQLADEEVRPWRWRNCRSVSLIGSFSPCPWDWRLTKWSYVPCGSGCDCYGKVWGIQIGPFSFTFSADIGNVSTGDWRARFGLSEEEAWERSKR